jgi:hypothetical protein
VIKQGCERKNRSVKRLVANSCRSRPDCEPLRQAGFKLKPLNKHYAQGQARVTVGPLQNLVDRNFIWVSTHVVPSFHSVLNSVGKRRFLNRVQAGDWIFLAAVEVNCPNGASASSRGRLNFPRS